MEAGLAFGARLTRLVELRGVDVGVLARRANVAEAAVVSVLGGGKPEPLLLRRLASALGLHRSDLFVVAGREVPEDLAPLDAAAAGVIGLLAWSLTYLPGVVPQLRQLVRSLPQQPRPPGPSAPAPSYQRYPSGAGGLVLRLVHNRNLDWVGSAKYLFGLGRGEVLSASTIGMIGHGRKELTPDLLAGFAAFLDISLLDLSALTGVDLPGPGRPVPRTRPRPPH